MTKQNDNQIIGGLDEIKKQNEAKNNPSAAFNKGLGSGLLELITQILGVIQFFPKNIKNNAETSNINNQIQSQKQQSQSIPKELVIAEKLAKQPIISHIQHLDEENSAVYRQNIKNDWNKIIKAKEEDIRLKKRNFGK